MLTPLPLPLHELVAQLTRASEAAVRFELPTGALLPAHLHVTEVARLDKKFVDCGGTLRNTASCRLQIYWADDTEHRIAASKLAKILAAGAPVLGAHDLPVEAEVEAPFLSTFPLVATRVKDAQFIITLGIRHTACLAEDVCFPSKLNPAAACQPGSGCC